MSIFSQNKKHIRPLSISASSSGSTSTHAFPWSAHAPILGRSTSPFPRGAHALSTSATATGQLFLFGGYSLRSKSPCNDLYVISTRDLSTTLLKTSGDVPSPRFGHSAVLHNTTLLIWGGQTDKNAENRSNDDSFYLLNLGTSDFFLCQDPLQLIRASFVPVSHVWTRIEVYGPGPVSRHNHTMTLVGSKLFVFGGKSVRSLNDIWALDLDYCTFSACFPEPF